MQHKRVQKVLALTSLTLLVWAGLPLLSLSGAIAGSITTSRPISWSDIWNLLKRQRSQGGSRGEFCLVSPGRFGAEQQIWHRHPLFLWQGSGRRIEVRHPESNHALWQQSLTATEQQVVYTGQPLQPGQIYTLVLTRVDGPVLSSFQVLSPPEHAAITAELNALDKQLRRDKASEEAIALQRARYFAERELWADALQEFYTVTQPSADLMQLKAKIPTELCQSNAIASFSSAQLDR